MTIHYERSEDHTVLITIDRPEAKNSADMEHFKQLREALGGDAGPRSDVVALNAACALEVAGIAKDLAEGVERARDCMQSGAALRVLERYAESSSR